MATVTIEERLATKQDIELLRRDMKELEMRLKHVLPFAWVVCWSHPSPLWPLWLNSRDVSPILRLPK